MMTTMTQQQTKNCAKLFLSELHQISTNFDNFWQKDEKEAKNMRDARNHTVLYHFPPHLIHVTTLLY